MMRFLFVLCAVLVSTLPSAYAQDNDWMTYGQKKQDSTVLDSAKNDSLDFSKADGVISVKADPRVATLIEFMGTPKSPDPVLMQGYRVQITYAQDKSSVQGEKMKFLNKYGNNKAYMDYLAPNFRIRAGNFKTRLAADKLKHEIAMDFPGATVVRSSIELPEIEMCDPVKRDSDEE